MAIASSNNLDLTARQWETWYGKTEWCQWRATHPRTKPNLIDLLVAGDKKHLEIIENALIAEGEHGITHVAEKSDIIWLKRQRNSLQDQADIERLENGKN